MPIIRFDDLATSREHPVGMAYNYVDPRPTPRRVSLTVAFPYWLSAEQMEGQAAAIREAVASCRRGRREGGTVLNRVLTVPLLALIAIALFALVLVGRIGVFEAMVVLLLVWIVVALVGR